MALYAQKTLDKVDECQKTLEGKGYQFVSGSLHGGFITPKYVMYHRPDGSTFYTETLKGLKEEVQR